MWGAGLFKTVVINYLSFYSCLFVSSLYHDGCGPFFLTQHSNALCSYIVVSSRRQPAAAAAAVVAVAVVLASLSILLPLLPLHHPPFVPLLLPSSLQVPSFASVFLLVDFAAQS